jgi:chromosome partitioning protein
MKTICVLNMKGGVGKTTTAIHIGAGLARRGERVLLIDADPQGNVSHALGIRQRGTIREVMLGEKSPPEVIVQGVRTGLDVLPSSTGAFSLEQQLAGQPQRETILRRKLGRIEGYDAMVIDTSPAMSLLTYNALLCSDRLVIPISMDSLAIAGARQTMSGITEIRELWPERDLRVAAVLPTFVNSNTNATRAALSALEKDPLLSPYVYPRGIRQCLDLTYATASRQTIWEYAPLSRAAQDFDALADMLWRDALERGSAQAAS